MKTNKNLNAIMLIIMILTFTNCNSNQTSSTTPDTYNVTHDDVVVVKYNGCEYIRFGSSNMSWGGHSGTCKNKIHNK